MSVARIINSVKVRNEQEQISINGNRRAIKGYLFFTSKVPPTLVAIQSADVNKQDSYTYIYQCYGTPEETIG